MKTYTLFGFTGSVMMEFCTLDADTIEDAARLIDCNVESKGTDETSMFRPHLIGARECASLVPRNFTEDEISRIAVATKNFPLQRLMDDKRFHLKRLQIGDMPRSATTFHGNNRLANNRDRVSGTKPNQAPRARRGRKAGHKPRGGANHRRYDNAF